MLDAVLWQSRQSPSSLPAQQAEVGGTNRSLRYSNIVAAGIEGLMSKAGLLAEHPALSLPRRPHRAAAGSQPIALVAFGFWITPSEFCVRKLFFGADFCSRTLEPTTLQQGFAKGSQLRPGRRRRRRIVRFPRQRRIRQKPGTALRSLSPQPQQSCRGAQRRRPD
jgi:hypothetical protein